MSEMIFGQRLRELRKAHRLTQEQLGEQLHVTRQTVSYWENGRTQPDYAMLAQIAQVFGVPVGSLLEEPAEEVTPETAMPPMTDPAADGPDDAPAAAASDEGRRGGWLCSRRGRICLMAALLAGVLAAAICAGLWGRETGRFTIEQFSQPQQARAGQAFLELTVRESPVRSASGMPGADAYFKFPIFIRETGGVGMTIERLTYVTFYHNGKTEADTLTGDILMEGVGATVIGPGEIRVLYNTAPAKPKKRALGVLIEGTDDGGEAVSFHLLVPYAYDAD